MKLLTTSFILTSLLLGCIFVRCAGNRSELINDRLVALDSLIIKDPKRAWDTLSSWDFNALKGEERAYAQLLLTIAQHKNGIIFEDDNLIENARTVFEKQKDYPKLARSLFYNGLVLFKMGDVDQSRSLSFMLRALRIMEEKNLNDPGLKALINAYLGRIHDRENNFKDAAAYCRAAIEIESQSGNIRNMILDQCELVRIYVKDQQDSLAADAMTALDRMSSCYPGNSNNAIYNTKAIFYAHCIYDTDSVLHYSKMWHPNQADRCAKMSLLASAYREKGLLDSAIFYEKGALESRRLSDSLSFFVYYRNLADYYETKNEKDSAAYYALLAYQSLHETYQHHIDKRVLELERLYDSSIKDAEIEHLKHSRRLTLFGAFLLLLVVLFLFFLHRSNRKQLAIAKKNEQLLDLQRQQIEEEQLVLALMMSTVKSYQDVVPQLKKLVNQSVSLRSPLQGPLSDMLDHLKRKNLDNLSKVFAVNESSINNEVWQKVLELLVTPHEKAVFLLTEMDYSPMDISQIIGNSADSIRSSKSYIRKKIQESPISDLSEIIGLKILNK